MARVGIMSSKSLCWFILCFSLMFENRGLVSFKALYTRRMSFELRHWVKTWVCIILHGVLLYLLTFTKLLTKVYYTMSGGGSGAASTHIRIPMFLLLWSSLWVRWICIKASTQPNSTGQTFKLLDDLLWCILFSGQWKHPCGLDP